MTQTRKIAVIGTGVIGASWAALFLAQGFDVAAYDPAEGAEARLRAAVAAHWPALVQMGLAEGADPARLSFHSAVGDCVTGAFFVQESGPERQAQKIALLQEIEAHLDATALIASSSSGLLVRPLQAALMHGERLVIGHPFNPPHLIPLVEVVAGAAAPWAVAAVMDFYRGIGKSPILLKSETPGHLANRLQAAVWREAMSMVAEGVCDTQAIDTCMTEGLGLRWALMGPFMGLELSGGAGGIAHNLTHMGPAIESWWNDLGSPRLSPALIADLASQTAAQRGGADIASLDQWRQGALVRLLAMKAAL